MLPQKIVEAQLTAETICKRRKSKKKPAQFGHLFPLALNLRREFVDPHHSFRGQRAVGVQQRLLATSDADLIQGRSVRLFYITKVTFRGDLTVPGGMMSFIKS